MKNLLFVLVGVIFCSCSSRETSEAYEIDIEKNVTASLHIDELFKRYDVVHLRMTDSAVVNVPRTIRVKNDVVYLSDGNRLFQFSKEGAHLRTLDRRGNGPQEYYDIMDFIVSENEILIVDRNRKFLRYTLDHIFREASRLDFIPASMHLITPSRIVFTTSYQQMTEKFHLYDLDSMNEIDKMGAVSQADLTFRHFMNQDNFFLFDGKILFHEPMNDQVLQIDGDQIVSYRAINLYGKNPPPAFWEKQYNNFMHIALQAQDAGYCYGLPVYAESDDQLIFTFRDGADYRMNRTDKNTGQSVQFEAIAFSREIDPLPVAELIINADNPQNIVFALPNPIFFSERGMALDARYDYVVEDGNPVIILGELR